MTIDEDDPVLFKESMYGCASVLIGMPAVAALQGLVWLMYWGWFITPLGVPPIGYWQGVGLALFVTTVTNTPKPFASKELKERHGERAVTKALPKYMVERAAGYAVALAFGFAVHWMTT